MTEVASKKLSVTLDSTMVEYDKNRSGVCHDSDTSRNFIILMTMIGSTFGVSTMGISSICAKSGLLLFPFLLTFAVIINYCSYYAFVYLTHHYKLENFCQLSEIMFGKLKFLSIYCLILCNIGNMVANIIIFNRYTFDLFKSLGWLQ